MKRRELLAAAVSAPLALALPDRLLAHGSGGTPTILVTADLQAHVVALDASTGRVTRRIRTHAGPRSIEDAFATGAVVAHTGLGRVSILDAVRLRVRHVLTAFGEPRYTAVHPSRWPSEAAPHGTAIAYVTDSLRREVVTLDLGRGRVLWRTAVPGPARHLGIDAGGTTLWTALGTKAERIAVLDLEDARRPRLVRTFATPFLAHDVVVQGFKGREPTVWVTSSDRRRIAVYELDGRPGPVAVIAADAPPQHVAFQGGAAFVTSGSEGTIRKHALDGAVLAESRVPVGSYNVATGWPGLVTPSLDRGTLTMVDERGTARRVRRVARAAHDACLVVSA